MGTLTCRLLPFAAAAGPWQMAADETLLQSAAVGIASLRFYAWNPPTLTLGYFQSASDRLTDPLLRDMPYVRRMTGGGTLVHHHEVTYCLTMPLTPQLRKDRDWLAMHGAIIDALAEFGVNAQQHRAACKDDVAPFLCFQHYTCGDVLVAGRKIAGSAQRKQRGAIMQHGGILLAQSPFAPSLPGIAELTGKRISPEELCAAVARHVASCLQTRLEPGDWTNEERQMLQELIHTRYGSAVWQERR